MKCKCGETMRIDVEEEKYVCECGKEINWGGRDEEEVW